MIIVICLILIITLLAIWYALTYNKLICSVVKVREAFSTMDVYLKKRYDLVPNLVQVVKGYTSYESETFSRIVELRNSAQTFKEQIDSEKQITNALNGLLVLAEDYPDLKADTQFLELQRQLKAIEDDIEKSRRYYNGTVAHLNASIKMFPNNIVAKKCNIEEEPFFKVSDSAETKVVETNF